MKNKMRDYDENGNKIDAKTVQNIQISLKLKKNLVKMLTVRYHEMREIELIVGV